MTLRKLNDLHSGEQLPDGSYVIIHSEVTICEPCLTENRWGFTEWPDSVAGESCEICA